MRLEAPTAMRTLQTRSPHPEDEAQSDEGHSKDGASEDDSVRVDDEDEVVDVDHLDRIQDIMFYAWRVTWREG